MSDEGSNVEKVAKGALTGAGVAVAVATALPIFGAIGVLTATGAAVASTVGAIAGGSEEIVKAFRDD